MGKIKTSGKLKESAKDMLIRHKVGGPAIRDKKLTREVLIEALMNDDLDTFKDVLISHLRAVSKSELAKEIQVGRQTLYDLTNPDIEFNPTLRTLGAILSKIS